MIERSCDGCGKSLHDGASTTRSFPLGRLTGRFETRTGRTMLFEVTTGLGSTWNAGDFCDECVIDAVRSLDRRAEK